ncbi:MAG: FtsX-like permease family protein [Pseudomonadota bacterium]
MFANYLIIAWRQLLKNKLYAAINIIGLVTGLSIYLFGTLLVEYEESHDQFFANAERTFTAASVFSPAAGVGVSMNDGIFTAFGPLIKSDVPEIEAVARTVRREYLVSVDDRQFYEHIRFADPDLLKIFDFDYIVGDAQALDDPAGVLMTEQSANKLFGSTQVLGKTLTLDHDTPLHVAAVIAELPPNTHLMSSLFNAQFPFGLVAPLQALHRAADYELEGNWNNLSMGDMTYMLFPAGSTVDQVQSRLDGVYDAHMPENNRRLVTGLSVRTLGQANTILYDTVGMPILSSLKVLALMVLIVAIVNYTNLATAQSLARTREVGLRKTLGATRKQLLVQFLVESVCVAAISMLIALAVLEIGVQLFNGATGRGLALDYLDILPWLIGTTVLVGLIAGAYPAYLITGATPITALRGSATARTGGGLFRNLMLGLQFTISVFMLAMVIVVYFQNQKVEASGDMYPRSQILTLHRLGLESIRQRQQTLRNELLNVPGVSHVSYSSQIPFEQSQSEFGVGAVQGDTAGEFPLMQIDIDEHFLSAYDIPLLAGRDVSRDIANDTRRDGALELNVIVNETALARLGFGSAAASVGLNFYDFPDPDVRGVRTYTIVGVVPDQNFQGFHNEIKPMVFIMDPEEFRIASVRVEAGYSMIRAVSQIESIWETLVPEYPMQSRFLDETFEDVFFVLRLMQQALAGFSGVALLLSAIGLFGLAAFMAEGRTREIGLRKVMGANISQIVRLLIWQFSRPVMWSLLLALPLAYFASNIYLNFFADRIEAQAPIVAIAGILAVLFAWVIVAVHAIRIARANPIHALRYE